MWLRDSRNSLSRRSRDALYVRKHARMEESFHKLIIRHFVRMLFRSRHMKKKKSFKSDVNLINLIERFGSDEKCRQHLTSLRWPTGVACPRCGCKSVSRVIERDQYDCNACRYQFSVTSGTIFHDSHLPLWKWFLTIYLMIESKKGISACQIQRTVQVSYKTAWFLCHRIRAAMREVSADLLKGIVEVDETYVGGRVHGRGMGYKRNKAVVVGAVERDGDIRLSVIKSPSRYWLHKFIHETTDPKCEAIYTDELKAYKGIEDADTRHETVNHVEEEWVRGDVHTNNVESVWSLLKRSVVGTYHKISIKHLDAYLDELEHRFNNRKNKFLFRDTLFKLVKAEKLPYAELTRAA
jgi:transposase-like protein